jgi:ribosomal protein S18 acetylase RimI-like enzyme
MTEPTFALATPADQAAVLAMHEAFFHEDGLVGFALEDRIAGLDLLLAQPGRWGEIYLIRAADEVAGYFVTTWGFTVELGGPFVLIDELYLSLPFRGRGWGRAGLAFVSEMARQRGQRAVQLEVEHHNAHAAQLYQRAGFVAHATRTTYELRL